MYAVQNIPIRPLYDPSVLRSLYWSIHNPNLPNQYDVQYALHLIHTPFYTIPNYQLPIFNVYLFQSFRIINQSTPDVFSYFHSL